MLLQIIIVLVAIALAIYFWYITILLIAITLLLIYRKNIVRSIKLRKLRKQINSKNKNSKEKIWNIIQDFSLSNVEVDEIFANSYDVNFRTSNLYKTCIMIAMKNLNHPTIPKYLILKLGEIFDVVSHVYKYELFEKKYYTSSKSKGEIESEISETQSTLRHIFENYEKLQRNQSKETFDDKDPDDNHSQKNKSYHQNYHYYNSSKSNHSRGKYDYARQKRIHERLEKFDISPSEAQIIFGKNWEITLGQPEWKFFFDVWKLEIKITYDYNGRYRRKFGSLIDKIQEIIRIVDEENPEMASQKNQQNSNYEYENSNHSDYSENLIDDVKIQWAFSIFDLKKDSTIYQIKQRYRELSLRYHPDRNHSVDATKKMSEINSAYELLSKIGGTA